MITSVSLASGDNINHASKNSGLEVSSSSSNVLRRMFKSKSKTRTTSSHLAANGHTSQKRHHSTTTGAGPCTIVNTHSPITIELVDNQLSLFLNPSNLFSIDSLKRFIQLSRPSILDDQVRIADANNHNAGFEVFNIYLQSVCFQNREPKRRSKLDQHRMEKTRLSNTDSPTSADRDDDGSGGVYYFIKCRLVVDSAEPEREHLTRLFKPNEPVNDLFQVRVDEPRDNWHQTELKLKLELFKLNPSNLNIKQVALNNSHPIRLDSDDNLTRSNKTNRRRFEVPLISNELVNTRVKLKFYQVRTVLPNSPESISLLKFAPDESNRAEYELGVLIERIFESPTNRFKEVVLIPKCLEILTFLVSTKTGSHSSSTSINQDNDRNSKNKLLIRIFECLMRTIEQTSSSSHFKFYLLEASLKQTFQDKQLIKCLINLIRLVIETDYDDNPSLYDLTMSQFDHLIRLLIALGQHSNSLYELKYNLNDVFMKLTRLIKFPSADKKRRSTFEYLNVDFLNHLGANDLFSASELSSLLIKLFEPMSSNGDEYFIPWLRVFSTHLFKSNHLFRERTIDHVLGLTQTTKHQKIETWIEIVKNILKHKSKLSKSNVDSLVRFTFAPLIRSFHSLVDNKPLIDLLKISPMIVDTLLSLVELINLILGGHSTRLTKLDQDKALVDADLGQLFAGLTIYFHLKTSPIFAAKHKLATHIDSVIFKLGKHVQKCLLKSVVNRLVSEHDLDNLITSYFRMLFVFVAQPNADFYTFEQKINAIEMAAQFWRALNCRLKRSVDLCQFLVIRLCKSWAANFYFRILNPLILKLPSQPPPVLNSQQICRFNQALFNFLSEIYQFNVLPDFDYFVYVYSLFFLARCDKLQKQSKKYTNLSLSKEFMLEDEVFALECSNLRSYAKCVSLALEKSLENKKLFGGRESLGDKLGLCVDYNLLKDGYEADEAASSIEKFLFIMKLIRVVDETQPVHMVSAQNELAQCRKKLKLMLLEDLYSLNKAEKNWLEMSFIRKRQADLLEWNSNGEAELKEILYLKSLKKFAINSLQEKFTQQESSSQLNDYYKSLEAGKIKPKEALPTTIVITDPASVSINSSHELALIQFEICKKLCDYYEKLDDNYVKFTRILNAESKFAQLAAKLDVNEESVEASRATSGQQQHHGHLYFRIGVFGRSLKFESIQNQYFLYKHKSYDMLSNIQSLIINKLAYGKWSDNGDDSSVHKIAIHNVSLLHHNHEPESRLKESPLGCYLQICALNRIDAALLQGLIDETSDDTEAHFGAVAAMLNRLVSFTGQPDHYQFFYFDRPFYLSMGSAASQLEENKESVENLWIERTVLVQDRLSIEYEPLTSFNEIHATFKLMLNPIRNAIADINEKTKELKHFVVHFTATTALNMPANQSNSTCFTMIHNLQPLTMRLLGCLDARVNGGLIKYVRELLNVEHCARLNNSPEKKSRRKSLLHQLYQSIKEQLNVLESGLSIHDRVLRDVEAKFSRDFVGLIANSDSASSGANFFEHAGSGQNGGGKNQKNYVEHIKHMNELNKHLIECLRLVTLELNERWAKFC